MAAFPSEIISLNHRKLNFAFKKITVLTVFVFILTLTEERLKRKKFRKEVKGKTEDNSELERRCKT